MVYDLHTHSTCSDGLKTPEELLWLAQEKRLAGLSITDHDTIAAYTPSLFELAKELDLFLGVGIELSACDEEGTVHLLGYGFQLESVVLRETLEILKQKRIQRNREMVEKLKREGCSISWADLPHKGRLHLARALLEEGYVLSISEAFERFLGDRAPCYVKGSFLTVEEGMELIHAASGKVFLAHPHYLKKEERLRSILRLPLDGIECRYGSLTAQQIAYYKHLAQSKGLKMSGGSDYHGEEKSRFGLQGIGQKELNEIFS